MLSYASRMTAFESSQAVIDILKLAERPDVISLAGGLPDPRVFPLERVRASMDRVLRDEGPAALNYGPNPGFSKLREWIAGRMDAREGVTVSAENILVTSGGVEALNLVAMALLEQGDTVIVGAPTYMALLQVLRTYGAKIESVPVDEEGLSTRELEARLTELDKKGVRPRFLYVNPSFQNPSGCTLTEARRKELVALCDRFGVPVVEDHAYGELSYDAALPPSLKALAPDNVIFVHTFSKIFGPGVRLGWVAAEPNLVARLGLCKLGVDQCANTLTQRLVFDYGQRGYIDEQVEASLELYRGKRDQMLSSMKAHLSEEMRWTHPGGGFFVWARLPDGIDSEKLLPHAIEREKTAFVAGPPFFASDAGEGSPFMRLSFSYVPEERIDDGVKRLARAIETLPRA